MRYLFLDRISNIQRNSIVGEKYLTINEDIFKDHFPGFPVLPAAFMTEFAIQLVRIFIWKATDFSMTVLPVNFKKFKFLKILNPGCVLNIFLTFVDKNPDFKPQNIFKIKIKGSRDEDIIFSGTMEVKIFPFHTFHNEKNCREYLAYLEKGL